MPPLRQGSRLLVFGLLVAVLHLRINGGIDLLFDPLGYGLAIAGVASWVRAGAPSAWTTGAMVALGVAALLSLPGALAAGPHAWLTDLLEGLAMGAGVIALLVALSELARRMAHEALAQDARRGAVVVAVVEGVTLVLSAPLIASGPDPDLVPLALVILVVGLAALLYALVLLWRGGNLEEPPASPPPADVSREPI